MRKEELSRRDVLKKTGSVLAAGMAAPYMITSTALGKDGVPAASDRVAVGCIGVGNRGRAVLGGIRRVKDAQIVAVSDCYKSRRDSMAKVLGATAHADFREILENKDVDAVVVATPDHWHVPVAVMAARAGKDAYVEKPLGVSIEQDIVCRDVFQEKKRIFQYGTQQRSMQSCWLGCELVRRGVLGKLRRIEVVAPNGGAGGSTQEIPVPDDLDYDMWNGPAEPKPYTADRCKTPGTYWIYDYSIGYLGGWGAHPVDLMVWGSDADLSGLVEIEGTGDIPQEGLYDTVWNWDMKGKLSDVEFTFKPGGDLTTFIGDNGWISVRRGPTDDSNKEWLNTKIDPETAKLPTSQNQQENFIDSVKSRQQAVSGVVDSARSDIISLLCDIAVRTGRKITWDPKQDKIVGDEEAAKMAQRPMRAPWTL